MNRQLKACPELSRRGHAAVTVRVTASAKAYAIATSSRRSKWPAAPPWRSNTKRPPVVRARAAVATIARYEADLAGRTKATPIG